jgi:hypothetical protein
MFHTALEACALSVFFVDMNRIVIAGNARKEHNVGLCNGLAISD